MNIGNYQLARPALVDTFARPALEAHRQLAQHAQQVRLALVPSNDGEQSVFLSLYGGVGWVALAEARQGRAVAIIAWED